MSTSVKRTTLIRFPHDRFGSGFSLIEVLISVLVLTVGLIGAAMMQLHAFRTTEQSNFHDTAVTLAMQIADEIRANYIEMNKGSPNPVFSIIYAAPDYIPPTPTNCYTGSCQPDQMAQQNLLEWQRRVQAVLPGGRLEICRDSAPVNANGDFVWCGSSAAPASGPIAIKVGWSGKDPGTVSSSPTPPPATAIAPPQVALFVTPPSQ